MRLLLLFMSEWTVMSHDQEQTNLADNKTLDMLA